MSTATDRVCPDCGSTIHPAFTDCFSCVIWAEQFAEPGGIIIDGQHYRVGPEPTPFQLEHPQVLGFGGAKFTIRRHDGTTVTTRNLWHQGQIPPGLARPDNAEFVKE